MGKKIKGYEFKHATHLPKNEHREDTHVVKEIIHYEDGTTEPNLRILKNFKRPFYVTKKVMQNHKDKKECELLENVNKYTSTQSDLGNNVAKALGKRSYRKNKLRDHIDSPYLYGADIDSVAILKYAYSKKYPDFISPNKVCQLDIENDVVTEEISVITINVKNETHVFINTPYFFNNIVSEEYIINKLKEKFLNNVPNVIKEKSTKDEIWLMKNGKEVKQDITYHLLRHEKDVLLTTFEYIHKFKPDILTVWNALYDISVIERRAKANGIEPKELFSDPSLPYELKEFKIKKGPTEKRTESGKFTGLKPQEQWHKYITPASYIIIDAMAAYNFIRTGEKVISSGFSLSNILNKELKLDKLKFQFPETENMTTYHWNMYMSKNKPFEYIIYNVWDVLGMDMLEEKTNDLGISMPLLLGNGTYDIFNSGPKKLRNDFFAFYLDKKRVLGVKGKFVEEEEMIGADEWIVTLNSWKMDKKYDYKFIEGIPQLHTNIRPFTLDLDLTSSYPSNTVLLGISKENTRKELLKVHGLDKPVFKALNMSLLTGTIASINYSVAMFDMISPIELFDYVDVKEEDILQAA